MTTDTILLLQLLYLLTFFNSISCCNVLFIYTLKNIHCTSSKVPYEWGGTNSRNKPRDNKPVTIFTMFQVFCSSFSRCKTMCIPIFSFFAKKIEKQKHQLMKNKIKCQCHCKPFFSKFRHKIISNFRLYISLVTIKFTSISKIPF